MQLRTRAALTFSCATNKQTLASVNRGRRPGGILFKAFFRAGLAVMEKKVGGPLLIWHDMDFAGFTCTARDQLVDGLSFVGTSPTVWGAISDPVASFCVLLCC